MKLDRVQDRIKSRLAGGLVVDIDLPDLELKVKIIKVDPEKNRVSVGMKQLEEDPFNIFKDKKG